MSSEEQFPEPDTPDTFSPIRSGRNLDFVLTLTQLHRIYTLSRTELIAELRSASVSVTAAHEALQDAFAAVAKTRFSFRSETAVIDWVRSKARARTDCATNPPSAHPAPQTGWEDVLRRANITISQASLPIGTPPRSRPGSRLRQVWSAARPRMPRLTSWRRLAANRRAAS